MELLVFVVHLGWAYRFGFKMGDGGETFPLPPLPPPFPSSNRPPGTNYCLFVFVFLRFIGIPSGRLCGGEKKIGKGGGGGGRGRGAAMTRVGDMVKYLPSILLLMFSQKTVALMTVGCLRGT